MGVNNPAERFPGLGAQASRVDQQGRFTPVPEAPPQPKRKEKAPKPPKKPGRGRKWLAAGVTTALVGGGIGAAVYARGAQTEPDFPPTTPATGPVTPGPTETQPSPTKPSPTQPTPTETQVPPPKETKPTGQILFGPLGEYAELGLIGTDSINGEINRAWMSTGVIKNEKDLYLKNGKWFLKVDYGNLKATFLLGKPSDSFTVFNMLTPYLPGDYSAKEGAGVDPVKPTPTVARVVEMIKNNLSNGRDQYGFKLVFNFNRDELPKNYCQGDAFCEYQLDQFENTSAYMDNLIGALNGESELPNHGYGFINQILVPPSLQ